MESVGIAVLEDAPKSVAEEVIFRVAAHANRDPLELPSLAQAIDPEALDALFPPDGQTTCELTFQYWTYNISIAYDNELIIELEPRDRPTPT